MRRLVIEKLVSVAQNDVTDLRRRLLLTRWGPSWPVEGWQAGTAEAELRRLVDYWASGYDWRAQERLINSLPSGTATIGGGALSYLFFAGEGPNPLPIILTNGWPSTVLELVELARCLAEPSRFGGRQNDSFTVVIPALPGFPLSEQRHRQGEPTHELWHELMNGELGFGRYAAHGGDLGAGITSRLAQAHPDEVIGIHLMAVAGPAGYDTATLTHDERTYVESVQEWSQSEGAYEHQHQTRPLTLAPALSDSPVGLLAWMLEKYRAWSDCDGDLSRRFTDDFLLTQASLYWFTNSISTSLRPYWEHARGMTGAIERVQVPTAVAVFRHDLARPPREWAERTYAVERYTTFDQGGHFAPHEETAPLAADIRSFFRGRR